MGWGGGTNRSLDCNLDSQKGKGDVGKASVERSTLNAHLWTHSASGLLKKRFLAKVGKGGGEPSKYLQSLGKGERGEKNLIQKKGHLCHSRPRGRNGKSERPRRGSRFLQGGKKRVDQNPQSWKRFRKK